MKTRNLATLLAAAIAISIPATAQITAVPNHGTVQPSAQYQLGCYPQAGTNKIIGPCPTINEDASGNLTVGANANLKGPGPHVDVLAQGIVGDTKVSHNVNVTGATATIAGGSVNFAAGDVGKIIGFNGGGPSGTITVAAPTPGSGGNLVSNINYRYQFSEIIDNATLPSAAGNTTNGWTLPTTEATVAEGANTKLTFGTPSANVTNATGIRLYITGPFAPGANSSEEVLQVPGHIAFGTVLTGGTGCVPGGAITLGAPSQAGGIQAVAHTTCSGAAISGVVIDVEGSGYTSNPSATPVNGTGTVSVSVGLLCGSQSAKNFRDSACDITSGMTLTNISMIGPAVPQLAGWRTTISAFTSTTQVTITDTIPNNISGGTNFAAWGTDNTVAWNSNVLAFANCNTPPTIQGTAGCHVIFPTAGANGAPTGRYLFLNGLPLNMAGMQVEGRGGRGSPPNGGVTNWDGPKSSATIVEFGDAYGIVIGSNTGSLQGVKATNLATEDVLSGAGWGGYFVGGGVGVSLTATHIQLTDPTVVNFVNGHGFLITNVQRMKINDPWAHSGNGMRFADNVSATVIEAGMLAGGGNTSGPGYGIWISNNPQVGINQFGNIVFEGTQLIDFYQGDRRIQDSSYNKFIALKQENISLTGGGSCPGGGTACYGASLLLEGNTASHCVNNIDLMSSAARNVNYISEIVPVSGGTPCSQTDVVDPIPTALSGNFCAQTPCNQNDASQDLRLGNNSRNLAQASYQNGGMAWGPDILTTSTPPIKCENGNVHQYRALGANATPTFSSTSCSDGQEISVEVCENGTGGFTWTWPAAFQNTSAISTAANACTIEVFHWDATNAVAVRDGGTGGSGASPAGSTLSSQYNAGSGSFGAATLGANRGTYYVGRQNTTQGTATAPIDIQAGSCTRSVSGTATDTVLYSDALPCTIFHARADTTAVTETIPTPTTLNNANAAFIYENDSNQTDTLQPTTFQIALGHGTAASTLSVPSNVKCAVQIDPSVASTWDASCAPISTSGGGTVSSVSNSDSTLTVSPTTGAVVASLNLGHVNTWSAAQTFSALGTFSAAGAASTPGLTVTGNAFTAGTATTNFPQFYINNGASGPTALSTSGTQFGINATSGFAGNFADFHINGAASVFQVQATGATCFGACPSVTTPGTGSYWFGVEGTEPSSVASGNSGFNNDSTLHCPVQYNNGVEGGCSDYNPIAVTGTNAAGTDHAVFAGLGTGNASPGHLKLQSGTFSTTSGTTAQTQVTTYVVHKKAGSTTSATATNMFNVALANNQTAGFLIVVHVETTQATPHNCSTTQTFLAAVQDTTATVTQQTTAGPIATICDTGTLTLAATFSAAAPSVFSVTPSWTTIVPTGVIISIEVHNLSQQEIALL